MVPAAEAGPIYSGVQNVTISLTGSGTTYADLDLDFDGTPDFSMLLIRSVFGAASSLAAGFLMGFTSNAVLVDNTFYGSAKRLPLGAIVSAGAGPFSTSTYNPLHGVVNYGGAEYPFGVWCAAADAGPDCANPGFAGVRFERSAATSHFAWIRLRVTNDADDRPVRITAIDWAYESEPEAAIAAGAGAASVPEPGSLALLAGGAASILAWRRRQRRD
jgi:hypothetical protein